jgi:hypothetical protein
MVERMETDRKITVHVPAELLRKAQRTTKAGITSTVRLGLELAAAGEAYRKLRALRGRVKVALDLDTLRADR